MRRTPDPILELLGEPSLQPENAGRALHAYRFFWARSFHEPRLIRITIEADNTAKIVRKAYVPAVSEGKLTIRWLENEIFVRGVEDAGQWVNAVELTGFWELANEDPHRDGMDGSNWTFEGVKSGRYHVVHRWTPEEPAVLTLGRCFLSIAGYEPDAGDFY